MFAIPSRASDAGPEPMPMDLADWLFEAEYEAEAANRAYKNDDHAAMRKHIANVETAVARLREMAR